MPVRRKTTVEEYTSPDPVTVGPDTRLDEVIAKLRENHFRHLPVVEKRKVVGIVSDRDVLLARPMGVMELMKARDVMTKTPYCVGLDAPLEDVALELSRQKFGSAVVLDAKGELYGIFTSTDALNALVEILRGVDGA